MTRRPTTRTSAASPPSPPNEPLGDPHQHPHRWMLIGIAMATQENGTSSIDWYAML